MDISSDNFFPMMIQRTGGVGDTVIECFATASLDLPNSWQAVKIYSTHHIQHTRLCACVGTGFFRFFPEETHVAQTTRRPRSSNYLAQTRLDDC